jgi:hypothetical protein
MVFVIQLTQARAQEATQRKLDEILRASPDAGNTLITLEEAPDNELKAATDAHGDARRYAHCGAGREGLPHIRDRSAPILAAATRSDPSAPPRHALSLRPRRT